MALTATVGSYTSAKVLAPGVAVSPCAAVCISASMPGPVELIMSDGSSLTIFAALGTMVLDGLSIKGLAAASPAVTVYVLN